MLWARPGATLPGANGTTITLGEKPVKGIVSPGMLCAEDELGLSDDHAGIVVLDEDDRTALGAPAQVALGLADWVLDVNAPANRGDVLGHLGIARELCAVLRGTLVLAGRGPGPRSLAGTAPRLEIADRRWRAVPALHRALPRGPDGRGRRRARIAQRLRAVGVRPISNLVDVTNYVLFELGPAAPRVRRRDTDLRASSASRRRATASRSRPSTASRGRSWRATS